MDHRSAVVIIGELRHDHRLRKLFHFEFGVGDESLGNPHRFGTGHHLRLCGGFGEFSGQFSYFAELHVCCCRRRNQYRRLYRPGHHHAGHLDGFLWSGRLHYCEWHEQCSYLCDGEFVGPKCLDLVHNHDRSARVADFQWLFQPHCLNLLRLQYF